MVDLLVAPSTSLTSSDSDLSFKVPTYSKLLSDVPEDPDGKTDLGFDGVLRSLSANGTVLGAKGLTPTEINQVVSLMIKNETLRLEIEERLKDVDGTKVDIIALSAESVELVGNCPPYPWQHTGGFGVYQDPSAIGSSDSVSAGKKRYIDPISCPEKYCKTNKECLHYNCTGCMGVICAEF